MKNKVTDGTYYTVLAFMVKDLHLKDVELAIYSIIYGFSQDGESSFTGSLAYLAEWTGKSRECVCRNLKSLVDRGLLIKKEKVVEGVKECSYICVRPAACEAAKEEVKDAETPTDTRISEIVEYLNTMAGTNYRAGNKQTVRLIRARLNEKYTVDDFKAVIDKKCDEWIDDDKMHKFLRPETLFGSKFDSYLNSTPKSAKRTDDGVVDWSRFTV